MKKITDKQRLDWLIKKGVAIYSYDGGYWFSDYPRLKLHRKVNDVECPRKLIDSAIRAEIKRQEERRKG